jgi:signal transduction histidine kinase/CheY-like chemotaxis protein/CHASE3 domain sensor protein
MPRDRTNLSRQLLVAILTPLALLLAFGVALTLQIVRMTETARWVDHTDEVIGMINDIQRQVVDQETAVRGFLLANDRAFLEPYDRAHPLESLDALARLVADSPAQGMRLRDIRDRYEAWLATAKDIVRHQRALEEDRTFDTLSVRKARMDAVRAAIGEMLGAEVALRQARSRDAKQVNDTTFVGGGILFAVLAATLAFVSRRQLGDLARTYDGLLASERVTRERLEAGAWIREHHAALEGRVRGEKAVAELAAAALSELAESTDAVVGALYVSAPAGWARRAGYALDASAPEHLGEGEGLVGQAARDRRLRHVTGAPADFLRIRSGTAERGAVELVLVPACVDGETHAVVELGFLEPVAPRALELLERVGDTLGIALRSAAYRARLGELLTASQALTEELQTQQEELRVTNEELQQQGNMLRGMQAELEERTEELEASNLDLETQRDELQSTQGELADKAVNLARASQYKSEFLANMSHELRTPLNSTLILARLLGDNPDGNLTAEQVKFAETIHSAGNDLLALINDILDLSKIEAGHIDLHLEPVALSHLLGPVTRMFEPIARHRGIVFEIELGDGAMETDQQRVQQILKNLLSNAFKFTETGSVSLRTRRAGGRVEISVRDTGIGISPDQQEVVFEAFRQADGTTNRKFGGTGLGLSISRDLARHLGGDLRLESAPGQGSTFTLTLPEVGGKPPPAAGSPPALLASTAPSAPLPTVPPRRPKAALARATLDDRAALEPQRQILLVVEDDVTFTDVLGSLAHQLDLQYLVAHDADEGVRLAIEHLPGAIVLDMKLPDHSGLSVLDRLKRNAATRHIPIHVISAVDHSRAALAMGAAGYLMKPVNHDELVAVLKSVRERGPRLRRVLVIEDDAVHRDAIRHLLEAGDVEIVSVATVAEGLDELAARTFDCVVTDLTLPGASGYDLLERMASDDRYSCPPVIVYTGRSLSAEDERKLQRYSSSIIVKGARSPERLLDEVTLFLHQVEAELPPDRQRMLRQTRDREAVFAGKKILIAEDDVRNIFALTSILEPKGATVILARNGLEALAALDANPDVDLVLMDIMMPEMDGLTAMAEIRRRGGRLAALPIIALTAKAMRDDQARCLAAGANDYLAKPLDVEVLLSLIRVWMRH